MNLESGADPKPIRLAVEGARKLRANLKASCSWKPPWRNLLSTNP
jgi:hypothetical protein